MNSHRERSIKGLGSAAVATAALLCTGSYSASAACPTLTPANIMTYLAAGNAAFKLDDEGYAATPLYLDLAQVAANGSLTGTMSTSPEIPNGAGVFHQISGTVSGGTGLAISFSYATGASRILSPSYTYSGAISFADQNCDLFIAGTYTTTGYSWVERNGVSVLTPYTAGPFPFSGKVVEYAYY